MGIFDQFFGKNKPKKGKDKSQYLPEEKKSKEIEFAQNFTNRGGKFIYCEDTQTLLFIFNKFYKKTAGPKKTLLDKIVSSPLSLKLMKITLTQKRWLFIANTLSLTRGLS